jgi:hypothetical protein
MEKGSRDDEGALAHRDVASENRTPGCLTLPSVRHFACPPEPKDPAVPPGARCSHCGEVL